MTYFGLQPRDMAAMLGVNTYLLLAEFSVRTVNYGPSFFRAWAINRWKKTRIRNLQYGPKKRG